MTFDDDERSVSQNRPIDLYTINTPTAVYRVTSHPTDVTYAGATYTATTMSRSDLYVTQQTGREMVVYLPISHPLVQRFAATGIPEHSVTVTIVRMQAVSGQVIQQVSGFATALSVDGHVAMIRVPSVIDDAMKVRLPMVRAQRLCNHVLRDPQCSVDRFDTRFDVQPPALYIVSQSGNVINVSTMDGHPDGWAQFGEAWHFTSGQYRMIVDQVGTTITLNVPFTNVANGDQLVIFAGCDHTVTTCRDKFDNVVNFGGMPNINPAIDHWADKGLGLIEQE